MPSPALERWQTERMDALGSLVDVHGKVTGNRRGRQRATEHLNLACFVSLDAEFQAFCRDLHDDAASEIASSLAPGNGPQIPVVLNALVRARKLDTGNAGPGTLGNDFAILGMTLWSDIYAHYPASGSKWNVVLQSLNTVRNGVAHSDAAKLEEARRVNPLTLATFKRWKSTVNVAASGIDTVVEAYLTQLTGRHPWV